MIKLKFNKPTTFELAKEILTNNDVEFTWNDADQMIFFASVYAYNMGKAELDVCQIWDRPSFKGKADYQLA